MKRPERLDDYLMAFVVALICVGIAFAGFQCLNLRDSEGGWHAIDAAQ